MIRFHTPEAFDALYATSDDPWGFRDSDYERRKRDITMAALPVRRFRRACEPGCSNGELTALLAARCATLSAFDGSHRAVELARRRVAGLDNVTVQQAWVPAQWPQGDRFDLVVLSEFVYYLPPREISALAECVADSLVAGGHVLACHWRHPIDGCPLTGDAIHEQLAAHWGWPAEIVVQDVDFVLHVWTKSGGAL